MKSFAFLLLAFLIVTTSLGQSLLKADRRYQPLTLEDAVRHLQKLHSDSLKQCIVSQTEEEFTAGAHFGLGMWMRNNWGLWRGGPLAKHFNTLGVYHPDDMSGIILTTYYRALRQQDWQLDQQVQRYQAYWQAAAAHEQRWKNDPVYRAPLQAQQDSAEQAHNRQQLEMEKMALPPGAYLRVYIDYQCGLLSLGEHTLLEGEVVQWVGNDIDMKITRYVDARKTGRVNRCNAVTNDTVRLRWHQNYSQARP
ncbi:DUF6794 domain-containing protein [Hymenobacter lucidus]|uniref:DUF6794 domain-containing protein n=1 Tax=Hymenobacter lucidus TaxID=2880930 RepID=A0ABS8AZE2_9BACT|nr:DUF6794 domain-containing protein [Hymenobacter lucidus]MCB2411162.1 hypothetical protein [Hymenobacter lucidus]